MSRRYMPTPSVKRHGQQLYKINYADSHTGFFPEESVGPDLPFPQAKAKAERMTNEYRQQQQR